jgi:hypothetical protein
MDARFINLVILLWWGESGVNPINNEEVGVEYTNFAKTI